MNNKYRKADYLLLNGQIITVNPEDKIAEAVVISDNRIAYVGSNEEALEYKVPETKIIDLAGKSVTPGFVDSHAHIAVSGCIKSAFVDVDPKLAPNFEKMFRIIEDAVRASEPGKWIIFWGYDEFRMEEGRAIRLDELDALSPESPVLFARCDGHTGIFNTKALEACNITLETAAKYKNNQISVTDGNLDGLFRDDAYYDMWNNVELQMDAIVKGLQMKNEECVKVGVTSVHDAGGYGKYTNRGYKKAIAEGKFKLRAVPMPFSMYGKDSYIKDIQKYIDLGLGTYVGNHKLKYGMMKIMIDGGSSLPSCAMKESYSHKSGDYGVLIMEPEEVEKIAMELHCTGHQITAHAVGDRAVEIWLDAIEKAQKKYPRKDCRHRIEHGCIMNEKLIKRVKELGVIPIPNPRFLYLNGDRYQEFFGDRVDYIFPIKSYLDAGIICAFGTDNPIIEMNPLLGISSAMSRRSITGTEVGANQTIGILDAIRMYTYNGAYAAFDEKNLGSIEEGKFADLAVFDGDLLTSTPGELEEIACVLTMIDGEIVYQKE